MRSSSSCPKRPCRATTANPPSQANFPTNFSTRSAATLPAPCSSPEPTPCAATPREHGPARPAAMPTAPTTTFSIPPSGSTPQAAAKSTTRAGWSSAWRKPPCRGFSSGWNSWSSTSAARSGKSAWARTAQRSRTTVFPSARPSATRGSTATSTAVSSAAARSSWPSSPTTAGGATRRATATCSPFRACGPSNTAAPSPARPTRGARASFRPAATRARPSARYGDYLGRIAEYVLLLSLLYYLAYRVRKRNHLVQ